MSTPHLEIEDPGGRRSSPLTGPLRLVAGGGDLPLEAPGTGELRLAPGRAEWLAGAAEAREEGAPPRLNGQAWSGACALADGDLIEWGAVRLVYRAAPAAPPPAPAPRGTAQLEELELASLPDSWAADSWAADSGAADSGAAGTASPGPATRSTESPGQGAGPPAILRTTRERAWRRVWSGLLVEQSLVAADAARAVQDDVRRREFDADEGAEQILAAERVAEADQRVLDRARALQRDLLMAPLNTSAQRAVRRVKNRASSGLAYLTAQFVTLAVYSFLILVALVLLRHRGVDLNTLLDGLLGIFGGGTG